MPMPQHFEYKLANEDGEYVVRVRYDGSENAYGSSIVYVNGERIELERFRRYVAALNEVLNGSNNVREF